MEPPTVPPAPRRQDTTVGSGIDFGDPDSRLAPLYLRTTGVVFAAALGFLLALYSQLPLHHTDVWAHLRHGDYIAETGDVRGPEPYSPFADPDARRPAFYWLGQIAYHALYAGGAALAGGDDATRLAGGAELLRQGHVAAIVAVYSAFWVAYRRATGSGSLALLGLALLFGGAVSTIGIHRPQLFALLLFAILYALLAKPVRARTLLVAVPLLFVLWVNTHGSYPVGLLLLGATAAGRAWDVGVRRALADRDWRMLVAAGALGVVALTFLNPGGPGTWRVTFAFAAHPNLKTILEWQPLNFSEATGGHLLYWASLALLIAVQWASPRGFGGAELALVATFGVAPIMQERFMAWWLPLCVGIALNHINEVAGARGWVWEPSTPSFRKTILAAVLLGVGCAFTPLATWAQEAHPGDVSTILHPATPHGLAETLAGRPGGDRFAPLAAALGRTSGGRAVGPVYCSESVGEFLYWRGLPDAPPMLFTHAHLFPPDYWAACLHAKAARPGWAEFLDRYRVNVVALEPLQPNLQPNPVVTALESRPGWTVVLDERTRADVREPKAKLFVAVRTVPLLP